MGEENNVMLFQQEKHDDNIPKLVITSEGLRGQYGYELATDLLWQMLEKGIITRDEFNKIDAKNRESFSPYLAELLPNYA